MPAFTRTLALSDYITGSSKKTKQRQDSKTSPLCGSIQLRRLSNVTLINSFSRVNRMLARAYK